MCFQGNRKINLYEALGVEGRGLLKSHFFPKDLDPEFVPGKVFLNTLWSPDRGLIGSATAKAKTEQMLKNLKAFVSEPYQ